jgi:hypothetical protein
MLGVKLASADSPGVGFQDGSSLGFKDFLSFGVELGLNERSTDGFEDGPTLAGLTLVVKLGSTDSPGVGFGDGSLLGFKYFSFFGVELGFDETSADGFEDGPTLGIKLGIGSTLDVTLASTDSPGASYKDGSVHVSPH